MSMTNRVDQGVGIQVLCHHDTIGVLPISDTIFKKSHNVIGFIAQQIKEVIPEAVELAEEYIPNIH